MGGGDVKLLTALSLWMLPRLFVQLLIVMALAGGVLTIALGMWHVTRRSKEKLKIPYGVAIALGGLTTIASANASLLANPDNGMSHFTVSVHGPNAAQGKQTNGPHP